MVMVVVNPKGELLPSSEPRDKSGMVQLPGHESEVLEQDQSEPRSEEKEREEEKEEEEKPLLETRGRSENQQNPTEELCRLVAPHNLSHGPNPLTKPHTPVKDEENISEDTLGSVGEARQKPTEELQPQEHGGEQICVATAAPKPLVGCCSRALEKAAKYLHQPCDPASLAAVRIMFGVLMVLDVVQERGMGEADIRWGDPDTCRFPLVAALVPLPLPCMLLLYAALLSGAVGVAAGWRWRASCTVYLLGYWYVLLLDKSTWNNHSYLYGLLTALMLTAEPHACWSVDVRAEGGARHVPFWNYFMLRAQVFFLYFFAGVKKLDSDWLAGHSMRHLGEHWVFYPFRIFVSVAVVDFYIIHLGGFLLDLTLGPLLLWTPSRKLALVFGSFFHLMNSQIFYIGMFPWVCLATLPIFCRCDWPRTLLASLPKLPALRTPCQRGSEGGGKADDDTVNKEEIEVKRGGEKGKEQTKVTRKVEEHETLSALKRNKNCSYPDVAGVTGKQKATTVLVACYLLTQTALPFSHSVTKGFNTWTEGPYGYSWDMMVHSWDTLHVKVTAVTTAGGHRLYVDPNMWVSSPRWSSHADMAVQYCLCVQSRLAALGHSVTAVHLDVWKSLNGRFQQRVFDPTVNILEAPWSPFNETPWVLPVVTELDHWRERLYRQQESEEGSVSLTEKLYVADFPGLTLENYLSSDLENVTLEVLKGEVVVLLQCEGGVVDLSDALHVPRSGGTNGTTHRQRREDMKALAHQPQHTAQEPSVESFNFEKGTDGIDLDTKHHDLTASIHRARQSLQELVASVHEGATGLGELPSGTAEVDVCSVALEVGSSMVLPSGAFHSVTTMSSAPAVYAYTFINATLTEKEEKRNQTPGSNATGEAHTTQQDSATDSSEAEDSKTLNRQDLVDGKHVYQPTSADFPTFEDLLRFIKRKLELFWRAGRLLLAACHCLLTRSCMMIE
ncbi:vitamin K-dependent gamma-carboxylase-like isoform X2 [Scylla paramamosain]|uniref:vitamin K-dependent gamma-carboxylase-like isoform X2 n=1 Tax=Scylla paramamosain TaxID=85552 RepID=UPI003082AA17